MSPAEKKSNIISAYSSDAKDAPPIGATEELALRETVMRRADRYEQGFRQRAILEIALYTGAKVSELADLRCGDLLLEPSALAIRIPSDTNPRILPLTAEMATYFHNYLEEKRTAGESTEANAALVCSQRGSKLTTRGWQDAWGLIQKHAGLVDGQERPLFNLESSRLAVGRRIYRTTSNPHHVQSWLGLDLSTNADRYLPEVFSINVEVLRAVIDRALPPVELRQPPSPSLKLAMGYYNGTAGIMNRSLARRLFLEVPPEDPLGQMIVARCLERGRCYFPVDPEMAQRKAAKVFPQVKELALAGVPLAMFLYAAALEEKLGCHLDMDTSIEYYWKALEAGVETAANNLGLMHHWGRGVKADPEKAFELFQRGATLHETSAMFNLAVMYGEGIGSEKNLTKSVRWYLKAAAVGDVRSMNNLSYLYHWGVGVSRDEALAERWYCLAGQLPAARTGIVKPQARIEMIKLAG